VPLPESVFRRDLVLRITSTRRITLLALAAIVPLRRLIAPIDSPLEVYFALAAWALAAGEMARFVVTRWPSTPPAPIAGILAAVDTLALLVLAHLEGGFESWVPPCFIPLSLLYGALLPVQFGVAQALGASAGLLFLGLAERATWLAHYGPALYVAGASESVTFIVLCVMTLALVNLLGIQVLHGIHQRERAEIATLETERDALLDRNEREAARVRALLSSNDRKAARVHALLEVAQHVSGTHSVDELLQAVCDTTVALVGVPRVEIYIWNPDGGGLRLAAGRGLAQEAIAEGQLYTAAETPIVSQLRTGNVVEFDAAASRPFLPHWVRSSLARGVAAPLVCRGSFLGALLVANGGDNAQDLKEFVQGIARQAAVALVNVRALEQQQEDAEVSGLLLDVAEGLSTCLDEEALWAELVRVARGALSAQWATAVRWDERSGIFSVASADGLPDTVAGMLQERRLRLEDAAILQELMLNRQLVTSAKGEQRWLLEADGWDAGPWLAVPLLRGGWVAGFLSAGHFRRQPPFSRRQLRLAEGLGNHFTIALQNARLVSNLEAADRLKSEFVSTMSHELRTPLNVIIGYTEMLRDGAAGLLSTEQVDLIERVDARSRELLELIEATLHVGRIEAGRADVDLVAVPVDDLVHALQASTNGLPCPKGVAFTWEVLTAPGDRVLTDRAKLALVVRNLVSNAFKFTEQGKVTVRLRPKDDTLVIEVADTGIGISAEHLPVIFEMFRQVDGTPTRRHGGVGLGLYIVKQFVRRLNGTVDVESTLGKGSVFSVVLPGFGRPDQAPRADARAA